MRFCAFFVLSLQKRVYYLQKDRSYTNTQDGSIIGWQFWQMAELTSCGTNQYCKVILQIADSTPFRALPKKQIQSADKNFVA